MPAGLALKRALGSIDVRLIDPGEISICKREDGSDWLLGAGSFGKVTSAAVGVSFAACPCTTRLLLQTAAVRAHTDGDSSSIQGYVIRGVLSIAVLSFSGVQGLLEREGSCRQAAGV